MGLLLSPLEDGVLLWGSLTIVTDEMGVSHSTISRLWRQACGACKQSLIITPEIALRNNSCANCLKYSHMEFQQGLKEIPQCHRKTYRSTAKAMGVALSMVRRMLLHRDVCRVHMSSLKPTLTEENKMSRMELALSFIKKNNTNKFENMEDLIHIDEKWFYLLLGFMHHLGEIAHRIALNNLHQHHPHNVEGWIIGEMLFDLKMQSIVKTIYQAKQAARSLARSYKLYLVACTGASMTEFQPKRDLSNSNPNG